MSAPTTAADIDGARAQEIADWRRWIHQRPELAYEEHGTAAFIADKLRAFGLDTVETGVGRTGVVGVLHGRGGPAAGEAQSIMLRSDIDALAIEERTNAAYASLTPGKMHACGHDGHTAMLLGAAQRLAETRAFEGTVVFCFQPAEEGLAGAREMIRDGLFDRYPVRAVYGMHNWPGLAVGRYAVRPGPMLAAADKFTIEIDGRGAHAARPDRGRDPLIAGAHLVTALQTIVSRNVDPLEPAVVSVTTFHAGSAFNVIPETAEITGTVRTFSDDVNDRIYERMAQLVADTARAFEVEARLVRSDNAYPATVNAAAETAVVGDILVELAGADAVDLDPRPTMGAEDFSFLARERPGVFIFIGNGDSAGLHNPSYDFNDAAAPHGVAYWSRLVETLLPAG